MPTVKSGVRAQADLSTNREKLDFAEGIALLDPNENPFTLMTMKFGGGTTGNIKHSWLEDELQPEIDTVNEPTTGYDSAATGIIVDNYLRFAPWDIVRHNATGEAMLVTAVTSSYITVVRDYGQGGTPGYTARADTVADGAYLTIIGNAAEQGAALPTLKSTLEVEIYNYCQDQRTPFGMSEIVAASALHGEQDWPFQQRKKGIEHMRKVEYQNIWGMPQVGGRALYSSGIVPATAGGIHHYITNTTTGTGSSRIVSQAEITQAEFLSFIEAAFEFGSAQKVMFCPPLLRSALDFWGISKLQTFSEKTLYGMKVAQWVSAHGTIIFVTHKMLKDPGSDGAYAFLLDMKNIKNITFSNIGSTRLRILKPYEADGTTAKKAEFQTISCIEPKQAKTHAVLYSMTSFAA